MTVANMMFASVLFPQTEKPPFEDVQETFKCLSKVVFTSPVRGFQPSPPDPLPKVEGRKHQPPPT